jgi:hypothetical protein
MNPNRRAIVSRRLAPLAFAISTAVFGCANPGPIDGVDEHSEAVTCAAQPADLAGHFAVQANMFFDVDVGGGLIHQADLPSQMLLITDVTVPTGSTTGNLTVTACDLQLPQLAGTPPLVLAVAPTVLTSIGQVHSTAQLADRNGCAALTLPSPIILVAGAKLSKIDTDSLPKSTAHLCGGTTSLEMCAMSPVPASGSCVCDQEGDGKPGATVTVTGAPVLTDLDKLFGTLRTQVKLAGAASSKDVLAGAVTPAVDLSILGCHRAMGDCAASDVALIQSFTPVISQTAPATSASTFSAKRVDASIGCAQLVAMRNTIFPPATH